MVARLPSITMPTIGHLLSFLSSLGSCWKHQVDWLRVLAKRRAAPLFSVNSRCSKQLFLLRWTQLFSFVELQLFYFSVNLRCSKQLFLIRRTQLFSFVELQVFLFVKLQLFLLLWISSVLIRQTSTVLICRTSTVLICWTSTVLIRRTASVLAHRTSTVLSAANFNCSYCCELQLFLLLRTSTVLITSN